LAKPPDFADYNFDGKAVLESILHKSAYQTVAHAVALLTKFSHPGTVAQTDNRNIFRTVRRRNSTDVGKLTDYKDGGCVMLDDNRSPTSAMVWANGSALKGYRDVQFNHIWSESQDVTLYTSLANICITPAFLSKLTDTDSQICALLRYRVYELYDGFKPCNEMAPEKPENYDGLVWAQPLPPVFDIEAQFRKCIATKPKDRVVLSVREIGWYFSNYQPERS
jgi:hypothetical protein